DHLCRFTVRAAMLAFLGGASTGLSPRPRPWCTIPDGSTCYSVSTHQLRRPVTFVALRVREWSPVAHPLPPAGWRQRPTDPPLISMAGETLVFRRRCFSHRLSLLMPTFSFPYAPRDLAGPLRRGTECSPTTPTRGVHGFGNVLMPDHYPCGIARPVSCYALFK